MCIRDSHDTELVAHLPTLAYAQEHATALQIHHRIRRLPTQPEPGTRGQHLGGTRREGESLQGRQGEHACNFAGFAPAAF